MGPLAPAGAELLAGRLPTGPDPHLEPLHGGRVLPPAAPPRCRPGPALRPTRRPADPGGRRPRRGRGPGDRLADLDLDGPPAAGAHGAVAAVVRRLVRSGHGPGRAVGLGSRLASGPRGAAARHEPADLLDRGRRPVLDLDDLAG